MNSILVPTDFSTCSKNALDAAIQIARSTQAIIELVHIYDRPVIGFVDLKIDHQKHKKLMTEIEHSMQELLQQYQTEDVKIKTRILHDIGMAEILDQPRFKAVDMVIMGSQGTSGLKELFIGSNTEKVVRHAKCPVLAIKEYYPNFAFNNVVLASNFYKEIELIFPRIQKFLAPFNPKFNLLKVNTPNNFETTRYSRSSMQQFAERFNLNNYSLNVYNDSHVESGILNFAKEKEADAIVIATHGRKGIEHFINGSLAEDVVNHAVTPVLSFRLAEPEKSDNVLFPE